MGLSIGGNYSLQLIQQAVLTSGTTDDTFDVSGWTGLATLIGGGGNDTLLSYDDGSQTLTDTSFVRSAGGVFTLVGITAADLTSGPGNDLLDASGFSGSASLFAGSGSDTLLGGSGPDYLDAGTGHDKLSAGSGNTILVGTEGAGDTLVGGSGQDTIYGSQGSDSIAGGQGSDVIYGGPVASFISGGTGPDTIVGGANNDTIYGNGGADVLIAGGTHVLIYADNPSGTGDTGAVSYLYGTYANEPGAGTDTVIGDTGSDYLFGAGDTIVTSNANSIVDNSLVDNPAPNSPPPVAAPTLGPIPSPGSLPTLPTGVNYNGRWTEFAGSATGDGLSNSPAMAVTPSIAAGPAGEYVAWADSRSGLFQIDVAELTASGWQSLGSLALGGAIVATSGPSLQPAIALGADGEPMVAWTAFNGSSSDIFVAQYDPTANGGAADGTGWATLSAPAASAAPAPRTMRRSSKRPVAPSLPGSTAPAAWRMSTHGSLVGGQWVPLGSGAASGAGVSASSSDVQGLESCHRRHECRRRLVADSRRDVADLFARLQRRHLDRAGRLRIRQRTE